MEAIQFGKLFVISINGLATLFNLCMVVIAFNLKKWSAVALFSIFMIHCFLYTIYWVVRW